VQPCVLFLDQLEMIAPVRGQDTSSEKTFDR
jgi:SpoVK/Ycf46/Vps4 family AAA+-type ATPase